MTSSTLARPTPGPEDSGPPTHRPLLVTGDDDVLDAVVRVAATVGVDVEVAQDVGSARRSWRTAPLVLAGPDRLTGLASSSLSRRPGVVVVGAAEQPVDDVALWRRAVDLRVEHVVFLPDGDAWLADRLVEALAGRPAARVVGVVGGSGGAGSSTLATALAVGAAREGQHPLLLDADPLGGGLDLVLGAEDVAGSRWADLADARGRVSATTLADVLPSVAGVSVLAWSREDRAGVSPDAMAAVLDGARRGSDLVVVDLPRMFDDTAGWLVQHIDTLFVVVPARVRAVAAARCLLHRVGRSVDDIRLVARGPAPGGLGARDVAQALGYPVVGWLDHDSDRAVEEETGEPPGHEARRATGRLARRLLEELAGTAVAA
ncbi:MAG: septum site-determining protein Ssd [Actinomycetes bacterium]